MYIFSYVFIYLFCFPSRQIPSSSRHLEDVTHRALLSRNYHSLRVSFLTVAAGLLFSPFSETTLKEAEATTSFLKFRTKKREQIPIFQFEIWDQMFHCAGVLFKLVKPNPSCSSLSHCCSSFRCTDFTALHADCGTVEGRFNNFEVCLKVSPATAMILGKHFLKSLKRKERKKSKFSFLKFQQPCSFLKDYGEM